MKQSLLVDLSENRLTNLKVKNESVLVKKKHRLQYCLWNLQIACTAGLVLKYRKERTKFKNRGNI
jgi:hypothetical protein